MKSKLLMIILVALIFFGTRYYYTHKAAILNAFSAKTNCDKFSLNSREYWDCRFKSQDWQNHHGDEQTLHFYTLMLNGIPESLQKEINENQFTVADFGCAQGEGTEYFASMLPNAHVTGIDISAEAIAIAKGKHKKASFLATDLTNYDGSFDVIISSNTLEHFYQPWDILTKLSNKAKKYMIILVPFDQPGIPFDEHFYSFNYQNIPKVLSDFKLDYSKIIYPDPKFWGEKQIILIFKKANDK